LPDWYSIDNGHHTCKTNGHLLEVIRNENLNDRRRFLAVVDGEVIERPCWSTNEAKTRAIKVLQGTYKPRKTRKAEVARPAAVQTVELPEITAEEIQAIDLDFGIDAIPEIIPEIPMAQASPLHDPRPKNGNGRTWTRGDIDRNSYREALPQPQPIDLNKRAAEMEDVAVLERPVAVPPAVEETEVRREPYQLRQGHDGGFAHEPHTVAFSIHGSFEVTESPEHLASLKAAKELLEAAGLEVVCDIVQPRRFTI
jgi:hypothetical protein